MMQKICVVLAFCFMTACTKKQNVSRKKTIVLPYGKDYPTWKQLSKRKIISSNHGDTEQEIYANEKGYEVSTGNREFPYPERSTFVLKRFKDGKQLPHAYVMRKMDKQYHPDYNNWKYSVIKLSNWSVVRDGKLPDCIQCHYKNVQRDYVPLMKKDGM